MYVYIGGRPGPESCDCSKKNAVKFQFKCRIREGETMFRKLLYNGGRYLKPRLQSCWLLATRQQWMLGHVV